MVGTDIGRVFYYENIGNVTAPKFVFRTGDANPFDGIDGFSNQGNPALADIDGDGDLDLALGDGGGEILYYENEGSPEGPQFVGRKSTEFPWPEDFEVENCCIPRFVDIDGDGDLDLVLGGTLGDLTLFENKANAAVAPKVVEIAGAASPLDFVDVDVHGTGQAYSAPTLVDLDGDGDLDVVVGHAMLYDINGDEEFSIDEYEAGASALTFFLYENTGSSVAPAFVQKTGSDPFAFVDAFEKSAATFGDLDQDGDLDMVVGDDGGYISYYENVGSLTVASYVARQGLSCPFPPVSTVGESFNPALGDIDGDGAAPLCLSRDPDRATNIDLSQATSISSSPSMDCNILRMTAQRRIRDTSPGLDLSGSMA